MGPKKGNNQERRAEPTQHLMLSSRYIYVNIGQFRKAAMAAMVRGDSVVLHCSSWRS